MAELNNSLNYSNKSTAKNIFKKAANKVRSFRPAFAQPRMAFAAAA